MMRVSMKSFLLGSAVLAVLSIAESARADSLIVGNFNEEQYFANISLNTAQGTSHGLKINLPGQGGDFFKAILGSAGALPFTYCVDLFHQITLPAITTP